MATGYPSISLATSAGSSNVLIKNCLFIKNRTAIYRARASNLTIDTVSVINSGIDPIYASNNGLVLNLKTFCFKNISFQNSIIIGSGIKGTSTDSETPAALTIKARNYPLSFNSSPASLSNVFLKWNEIGGPHNGIRIGENGITEDEDGSGSRRK